MLSVHVNFDYYTCNYGITLDFCTIFSDYMIMGRLLEIIAQQTCLGNVDTIAPLLVVTAQEAVGIL